MIHLIPERIWNTQCQMCRWRENDKNEKVDRNHGPCHFTFLGADINDKCKMNDGEIARELSEYYKTHNCKVFSPADESGLCSTCRYFNGYMKEKEFCTHDKRPVNRKNKYPECHPKGPGECWKYAYYTCDNYEGKHSNWTDICQKSEENWKQEQEDKAKESKRGRKCKKEAEGQISMFDREEGSE